MNVKNSSLKQKLYNQTPWLITLGGYLIGVGILVGALVTRYIPTDISVQGAATIQLPFMNVNAPDNTVLLNQLKKPGQPVKKDEVVAILAADSESVTNFIVSQQAVGTLKRLTHLPKVNEEVKNKLLSLAALSKSIFTTSSIAAPADGWVLSTTEELKDGKPTSTKPVIHIANFQDNVTIEVEFNSDLAPTIKERDQIQILLKDLSRTMIPTVVEDVLSTVSLEVTNITPSDQTFKSLVSDGTADVKVFKKNVSVRVALAGDTLIFEFPHDAIPQESLKSLRATKPVAVLLISREARKLSTKVGKFASRITLTARPEQLGAELRGDLENQLKSGSNLMPAGGTWVKIGTRPLFNRLFDK